MDFSFGKIGKLFSAARGGSAVGVDIGSSSIKVVQLSKKGGRVVLDTYGALALGPYAGIEIGRATGLPPEKIAEVLIDLYREAAVTDKQCGVAIPLASSLVSMIEMPKIAEKELAQMIPIEARKYVPVSISEVALDWWVVPKASQTSVTPPMGAATEKREMIDVLLVVILNDALRRYQDIIRQAGSISTFFEIEIFSTIRSVLEDGGMEPTMIIDCGAGTTKLYIIERGIVRVSHSISKGAQDITLVMASSLDMSVAEAENLKRTEGLMGSRGGKTIQGVTDVVLRYVFTEANLVLTNYQKKTGQPVGRVVLTGGGSTLKGILDVATQVFETDVVLGDPFSKVQTPAFMEPVLKQVGPEFAVALGLALRRLSDIGGV